MPNKEEFVKKCEEVYRQNQDTLEEEHPDKIVALYEGGIAAIGDSTDGAYREAKQRYPDRIFYFRRIGKFPAADFLL